MRVLRITADGTMKIAVSNEELAEVKHVVVRGGMSDKVFTRGKTGEWIPVSERLPEIGEYHVSEPCIVYCSNGAYGFAELEENLFGQVGWNCERDDEYHEPLGEVLAWMPLPEPWKGEEDETDRR